MPFWSDVIPGVMEELARRIESDQAAGLTTGVGVVDEMIGGGLMRQQLSYLVGDSGVGKSWLVSSITLRGSRAMLGKEQMRPSSGYSLSGVDDTDTLRQTIKDKTNKPPLVVFWSLEMPEFPIVIRLITQLTRDLYGIDIDSGKLLGGRLGKMKGTPEWEQMRSYLRQAYGTVRKTYGRGIYLEFRARTFSQFRAMLNDLAKGYDTVLIVVDYFRLIQETAFDGSMATLQEERSVQLRDIAKTYDCHVLAVFDINRLGQRAKSIETYHMRGGVAANYDADLVFTLDEDPETNQEAHVGPIAHLVLRVKKGRYVGSKSRVDLWMDRSTGHVTTWQAKEGV